MGKLHNNQNGFGALVAVLVVVIIAVVGTAGYLVYKGNLKSTTPSKTTTAVKKAPVDAFALASEQVTFNAPTGWTKDGIGCIKDSAAYGSTEYLDSTALLPGEKLRTVYGDGTEYFHVNVCVFGNSHNLSPEAWFNGEPGGLGAGGGGYPSTKDVTSKDSINGNPAYYIKFVVSEHEYDEVHYVIAAKDKIIEVSARTYETNKDLPGVGDFRKFEPAIKALVNSIQIN